MCAKILEAAGKVNMDEYNFFLRGGLVGYLSYKFKMQLTYCSQNFCFETKTRLIWNEINLIIDRA